jgi:hypothetical protein
MVLLPVAIGLAVLALLAILRSERHQGESGIQVKRPVFGTLTLAVLALFVAVCVTVYVVSALTA